MSIDLINKSTYPEVELIPQKLRKAIFGEFFLVTRKSLIRKNLSYSRFSLFERKDAAKEAKRAVPAPISSPASALSVQIYRKTARTVLSLCQLK